MLLRDVIFKSGRVVYMVEAKILNDMLWRRNPILRDNFVSVGTLICIVNPNPITSFSNDTPIIEFRSGCYVMRVPSSMESIGVYKSITKHQTRCFLFNNVDVNVDKINTHVTE